MHKNLSMIERATDGHDHSFIEDGFNFTENDFQQLSTVSPLVDSKIIRRLGTGSNGTAFELNNGRVLKVEINPREINTAIKDIVDDQWSGTATKNDMPTFGYWKIKTAIGVIEFVEMAKILPYPKYLRSVGKYSGVNLSILGVIDEILMQIKNLSSRMSPRHLARLVKKRPEELFNSVRFKYISSDYALQCLRGTTLDIQELENFITAWVEWEKKTGIPPKDVHRDNIGIDLADRNKWYLFDVYYDS